MKLDNELSRLCPNQDTLLTIGVFDGIHLGHQQLIQKLKQKASESKLLPGVVTFDPHPRYIITPGIELPCLTTPLEKVEILSSMGLGIVALITFTKDVAGLSARDFLIKLKKHLRMKGLLIGPDFAMGHGREGSADNLFSLSKELEFSLEILSGISMNGDIISSTSIRKALTNGDLKKVTLLLGRPFALTGTVVKGDERGRLIGYPTANMKVKKDKTIPADGIYITRIWLDGKPCNAVTSIGLRPTFEKQERTVETYILDFSGDLYGQRLKLEFLERLRDEKKFSSVEELIKGIAQDVEQARAFFRVQS